jgi:hypothetical protein
VLPPPYPHVWCAPPHPHPKSLGLSLVSSLGDSQEASSGAAMPPARQLTPKEARRKKDLYVHRPWLDHLFTVLLVLLVGFVFVTISKEAGEGDVPAWVQFPILLLLVAAVVSAVKKLSAWLATILNTALVQAKLVDKPPLRGKVQMKKWQDQFWQLVVHVSMTAFEVYVLRTDLSGLWSDMSLAWVPEPRVWKPSRTVRLLYWTQLVRWWARMNEGGG